MNETILQPIVPDYAGANVRGLVPALLGPGSWETSLPDWFPDPVRHADQVVLLHGLGRTESAMLILENSLAGAGFEVHNIGYPSNDAAPEELEG